MWGLLNLKITYTYSLLIHCLQIPRRNQTIQKSNLHLKSIFEQLGGTYHEENRYLIPDLGLPAEAEKTMVTWGQRHLDYLKQYRKVTYTNLLTSGKLNNYHADIGRHRNALKGS